MSSYRCFFLNLHATIAAVEFIEAQSDAEAVALAEAAFRENEAGLSGYELWDGARIVQRELDSSLEQIRRWRMKAEELRTGAEGFADNSSRQYLLNAAETYEALAKAAAARLERRTERKPEAG
jgi:hypothetical protein